MQIRGNSGKPERVRDPQKGNKVRRRATISAAYDLQALPVRMHSISRRTQLFRFASSNDICIQRQLKGESRCRCFLVRGWNDSRGILSGVLLGSVCVHKEQLVSIKFYDSKRETRASASSLSFPKLGRGPAITVGYYFRTSEEDSVYAARRDPDSISNTTQLPSFAQSAAFRGVRSG